MGASMHPHDMAKKILNVTILLGTWGRTIPILEKWFPLQGERAHSLKKIFFFISYLN